MTDFDDLFTAGLKPGRPWLPQLPPDVYAWCEEHGEPELVDWETWVAEMVPGLEQAYPDIEFWVL